VILKETFFLQKEERIKMINFKNKFSIDF